MGPEVGDDQGHGLLGIPEFVGRGTQAGNEPEKAFYHMVPLGGRIRHRRGPDQWTRIPHRACRAICHSVRRAVPVKKSGARAGRAPGPRPEFSREDRLENSIFMNTRWSHRR